MYKYNAGALAKLREFITSPEGVHIMRGAEEDAPSCAYSPDNPIETAALNGQNRRGWQSCLKHLWDISDPEKRTNLK